MMEPRPNEQPLTGTPAYDNWFAFNEEKPALDEYELPLYTDAQLTGQPDRIGPYTFINAGAFLSERGEVRAAVVLRYSFHVSFKLPGFERTEQSRYHGGWVM